jgi:S-methylmethionine-dependent homocysteine/selenocysteine methylase
VDLPTSSSADESTLDVRRQIAVLDALANPNISNFQVNCSLLSDVSPVVRHLHIGNVSVPVTPAGTGGLNANDLS